jgi:peptidoglycan LD-endopeptidase LytH
MKKAFLLLPAVMMVACNGLKSIKSAFTSHSPYEHYVESLKKADLLTASMAKEWLLAGQEVFDDSVIVNVPFSESGFFEASAPEARSYRFSAKDGQVLTVGGAIQSARDAEVFLDLFIRDDEEWERVVSADSLFSIKYEFRSNEECILRLQPELLANTYYAINISLTPVLINPVFGASNRSIGSFFGAPRDNGKRSHEGVDIFARKGTPVIAPADGVISRVSVTRLGGKVVWMKDPERGHSYYFAHLDSQMVKPGMRVYKGHVLGLVGNTGNAIKTPPHLHFGIYRSGAKDPLHYIHQVEQAMATLPIDTGFHQKPFRIKPREIPLRTGPSPELPAKTELTRDTYVTVIGQSNDWYRIALPDATQGYLLKKHLVPLPDQGQLAKLDTAQFLLSTIQSDAVPVALLRKNTAVQILARFQDFRFVMTEKGKAGWLYN